MSLGEKTLISRIRRGVPRGRGVITGIGDDCAVLRIPAGHQVLVTTDFTIEGVHFRRAWHPPEVVGFRCLARGLSDLAAMGGDPQAAFLSLALPRELRQNWIDQFMKGLLGLASSFNVALAGGDTSESPHGVLADIVVVGSVPKGWSILRSSARPGDRLYVTGELGGAAAALGEFMAGRKASPKDFPRHFHPDPRVAVGRFLRKQKLASAMIDLSDGLSTDLAHLCEESGVGAEIVEAAIPRARIGKKGNALDIDHALHGGEDYELLFTAHPGKHVPHRIAGVAVTLIGEITRSRRVIIRSPNRKGSPLQAQGWQHFRK